MRQLYRRVALGFGFSLLATGLAVLLAGPTQAGPGGLWHDRNDRPPLVQAPAPGSFNPVAEATIPAVVYIGTSSTVRPRGRSPFFQQEEGEGMPNHPFFDFFRQFEMPREYKQQGLGSGFLINENGYILTNNHVIERADEITVTLNDEREFPAEVIGTDPMTDLALIRIKASGLPWLPLGDSDALRIGDWVVAVGNPIGLDHSVTAGIVSQKGRTDVNPGGRNIYANFIQTDAAINPGNSGGPLVNLAGEVVGINTAIANAQGIGFAIPVNMAKQLLPQLSEKGRVERSWIGVRIQPVSKELAESFGLDRNRGAVVADVVRGSPAEQAGIQPGDVILSFDGAPVKSHSDLAWLASSRGAGAKVKIQLFRDGRERTVIVTLGRMPEDDEVADAGGKGGPRKPAEAETVLGIGVEQVGRSVLKKYGLDGQHGVAVTSVAPDSPAAGYGLRPGDIVRSVNGREIRTVAEFKAACEAAGKGRVVRMQVQRGEGVSLFLAFRK